MASPAGLSCCEGRAPASSGIKDAWGDESGRGRLPPFRGLPEATGSAGGSSLRTTICISARRIACARSVSSNDPSGPATGCWADINLIPEGPSLPNLRNLRISPFRISSLRLCVSARDSLPPLSTSATASLNAIPGGTPPGESTPPPPTAPRPPDPQTARATRCPGWRRRSPGRPRRRRTRVPGSCARTWRRPSAARCGPPAAS